MKKAINVICFSMLIITIMVLPASATTLSVCTSGCDHTNIQDAIDASSDGDTVYVYSGTYSGDIYIEKNITLTGEGADVVTIDGSYGIIIGSTSTVNGCIVEGFNVLNSQRGVSIYPEASNCTVRNNIIDGLTGHYGNIIYSKNNSFTNNVITSATTTLGALYLWSGANYCTIANNTIINNQLTDSDWAGAIVLEEVHYSQIIDNTIVNNAGSGILLYASDNNTITRNNISLNERGLWWQQWDQSEASDSNQIYLNNFNNNEDVALYEGCIPITDNIWNSTSPMPYFYEGVSYTNHLGNYWSNYTGSDNDGDGIGDDPYAVPNSSDTDFRPLMTGFENYQETYQLPPASSSVTLGATILPAISIEVTPATLNFGTLSPGQSSSECILSINNTGGSKVRLSADVTDTANNLYISGLLLDSGIWSAYSAEVIKSAIVDTAVVLDVPGNYAGVGTQEGTLIIWAEAV
jgi:parallel beta-helix repeat protein